MSQLQQSDLIDDAEQAGYLNGYRDAANAWWRRLLERCLGPTEADHTTAPRPATRLTPELQRYVGETIDRINRSLDCDEDALQRERVWRAKCAPPVDFVRDEVADAPADSPALQAIVDRVRYALGSGSEHSAETVALIVNEALWQIGWLIRQGASVEVPEVGTFRRHPTCDGGVYLHYAAARSLLEVTNG